jgi:hypothetical protein
MGPGLRQARQAPDLEVEQEVVEQLVHLGPALAGIRVRSSLALPTERRGPLFGEGGIGGV